LDSGTETIALDGTCNGISFHETITTDGDDYWKTISVDGMFETKLNETNTGLDHDFGTTIVEVIWMMFELGMAATWLVGTELGTYDHET
jgi:hypothetical protein